MSAAWERFPSHESQCLFNFLKIWFYLRYLNAAEQWGLPGSGLWQEIAHRAFVLISLLRLMHCDSSTSCFPGCCYSTVCWGRKCPHENKLNATVFTSPESDFHPVQQDENLTHYLHQLAENDIKSFLINCRRDKDLSGFNLDMCFTTEMHICFYGAEKKQHLPLYLMNRTPNSKPCF